MATEGEGAARAGSPGADPTRAQIRGSSLLLGGQVFALVVNFGVQILIVRTLSKTDYGFFAYALSIVMIGEVVAMFGLHRGVSRFLPIYEEHRELDKVIGTLVLAVSVVLSLGLAVVLAVVGLKDLFLGGFSEDATAETVLTIMILLSPVQALENLLDGVFAVFARPRTIVLRKYVLAPLLRLTVVVLLALSSSGVEFLAAGYLASGAIGIAIYGALLVPVLRERGLLKRLRNGSLTIPARELMGFTVPLLTNDLTAAALNGAGALMLGLLVGPREVAEFSAAFATSRPITYVLTSFGILFVPLAARLYARRDGEELNRLYWQTAVWTAVLAFPIFIVMAGVAKPVVVFLLSDRYESSAPVLAVIAFGHFVTAATGPNGVLLGVYGQVRYIVLTNVAAVVLTFALYAVLIPEYGALGAAIATSITWFALNVTRQVGLTRRTDVEALDTRYLGVYTTIVVVTAAVVTIEVVLAPSLVPGLAIAALASAIVLAFAQRRMNLAATFPEIARLPGLRRVFGGAGGRR